MKYELIGDNDYIFDLQASIFSNRGIEKNHIKDFLNLTDVVTHDYNLLNNMDKGVKLLLKHLKNNSKIHIVVD